MKKTNRFLAAVMVFVFTFSMLTSSFSGTVLVSESTGEEFLFDIVVISDESLDSDKNVKEKTFNISPIISESDSSIEEKSDIYIMKDVIEDVDTKQFTDIEISLKESLELYYQYELELLSKVNNNQIISQRYKNTESAEIWDIEIGTDYEFYTDLFSIINQNEKIQNNRIEIGLLIGIICGSVAIVLIIVGIIVWFVRNHNKNLQSSSDNELDKTYTEKVSTEKIDEGIGKMVMEDVDQWIWAFSLWMDYEFNFIY